MYRSLGTASVVVAIAHVVAAGPTIAHGPVLSPQGRFAVSGLEESQVRSFLVMLQSAVRRGDAATVADLVSYPLRVNRKDGHYSVRGKAQFVKRFSSIFDSVVKRQILGQRFEDLFANSNAVMIGSGTVWFSGVCDDDSPPGQCKGLRVLVVAINPSEG